MKCIQCNVEIDDGKTIIPIPSGAGFTCSLVCHRTYEKAQDEYGLHNHPYYLAPIMLKDNKMFMWYSVCSVHRSHDPECGNCFGGSWIQIVRKREQEEIDQFGGGEYAEI